jgi:hypothetical protein
LPLFLSTRRRLARRLLLGPQDVVDPESLVLKHAPRNGCAGIFVGMWLMVWCFMLVEMCRHELHAAKRDPAAIPVMTLLAAIAVAGAVYVAYELTTRDELRMDARGITYARRVIVVVLRRWEAPLDAVKNIDLCERTPPRAVGPSSGSPRRMRCSFA